MILLTYVMQMAGVAGILLGLFLLVRSGPPYPDEGTTYWYGDQQISRAEYLDLRRQQR